MTENTDTSPPHDDRVLVVIGGSHCGVQSAFAARRAGFLGRIVVLSDETHAPYHRPPLSKDLMLGVKGPEQIQLRPPTAYEKSAIELIGQQRVVRIDRDRNQVVTAGGDVFDYSALLLATGARPRVLPIDGQDLAGVHYLRSMDDALAIQQAHASGKNVVVIGGGYIGLEAAASLRKNGCRVTVIEAMDRVLARVASAPLSEFYAHLHQQEGVVIRTGETVAHIAGAQQVEHVVLGNGERLSCDLVVVGIGVVPNTELAAEAGLTVNDGIVVNPFGATDDPAILAAGDCARGPHALYAEPVRIESVQNANDQGKAAVMAWLGQPSPYAALPWFWSDQYDVKLQIAGVFDTSVDQTIRRQLPDAERAFALCHLVQGRLSAVEAVNQPRDFLGAKTLIAQGAKMDVAALEDATVPIGDCVIGD
ncbi:MAG: FAD-dependent oxidoreductase [Pseudomonadota bacterium]